MNAPQILEPAFPLFVVTFQVMPAMLTASIMNSWTLLIQEPQAEETLLAMLHTIPRLPLITTQPGKMPPSNRV